MRSLMRDSAAALLPLLDSVLAVRSVRVMESLQACGPAIRRAALASRARAPAARFQAADCPAESPAAARWACPALTAESRAARSALHRDLAVVAEIGPSV